MMTKIAAGEWAPEGVRVNAICPGVLRTPMWDADVARGAIDEQFYLDSSRRTSRAAVRGRQAGGLPELRRRLLHHGPVLTIDGALTSIPAG